MRPFRHIGGMKRMPFRLPQGLTTLILMRYPLKNALVSLRNACSPLRDAWGVTPRHSDLEGQGCCVLFLAFKKKAKPFLKGGRYRKPYTHDKKYLSIYKNINLPLTTKL